MDTIIFDIDGTLADVSHRRHLVTSGKRDWKQFFEKMIEDPPLRDVCLLAELLGDHPLVNQGAIKLFIFSGRPESYRVQTTEWLSVHVRSLLHKAEALHMRAEGDYRPDTEVKREMLRKIQAEGYIVRLVIDDRPSVIQMWKSEGLTVLACDSGEWEKKVDFSPGRLDIMVGPSGAGKTYFLNNNFLFHVMKAYPKSSLISTDSLREEITRNFRDQSKNDQIFAALHNLVEARINTGLNTIVDATNLHSRDRRALRDLCPSNTEIHYWVIDRPLAEKFRDGDWRDEIIIKGEKLIDRHHKSFQSGLKYILAGDNDPRVTVHDERKF